ncbi:MAG: helicase [Chloroflexi bacterium]|nr:hypothetical protein [Nitrososphaera sp.]MCI0727635.1 helicase [Chloroflexota bacterium]
MPDHTPGRAKIVQALLEELVGPAPAGTEWDFSEPVVFPTREASYGPWRQNGTGEEVLQRDKPTKRYGIGVLYPAGTVSGEAKLDEAGENGLGRLVPDVDGEVEDSNSTSDPASDREKQIEQIRERLDEARNFDDIDANDLALSLANSYSPSSMGISFLAEFPPDSKLVVKATGGRYTPVQVQVDGREREWWLRAPVSLEMEFHADKIHSNSLLAQPSRTEVDNADGLSLNFEVLSRRYGSRTEQRLVTVSLVNRSSMRRSIDRNSLFQSAFEARVVSPSNEALILPYPRAAELGITEEAMDEEERSIALLYRNEATYAAGHGCAANWERDPETNRATVVRAEALPLFEAPSITPDIKAPDGTEVTVSMASLAGLQGLENGFESLERVITLYEEWINTHEAKISALEPEYQEAAHRHLRVCRYAANRMRHGLAYLQADPVALKAFRLANHAILLQQARSWREPRRINYDAETQRLSFSEPYPEPDILSPGSDRGNWRAFQIAFLLMTLESAVNGDVPERHTVELIWFPTGGGKTEAYLGLAAFTMFMRRLRDAEDTGVHVLMRYTLRLLTTQQFQRAARLICAMEYLRRQHEAELGQKPFSIGMWVGGASSPNTRNQALSILNKLQDPKGRTTNLFVLDQCPWCGAQMGPLKSERGRPLPKNAPRVVGYERQQGTVVFRCPDRHCDFSSNLPVYVIDEDVYEVRPSIIIGTVDKFALLAWRPEARSLFGLALGGRRVYSPPGLIIQDELHLISGPLGSMVGLYESIIEELCTDRRGENPVLPKIISSTATTRRYAEQIHALYARREAALFPPPGLDASDSFFGRYARDENGNLRPGRLYVGIHAPGLGSLQTVQVRSFTALLQAPLLLAEDARDPWWTLLIFFNSLRELGTTLSLFQSDIPDYQKVLVNRLRADNRNWRSFWRITELTGRANSEEVSNAITDLETSYPNEERPVDVCLASSILEVGVDIDRLSLMCVVGQPKTTAQYIQVTGRIGRRWSERPGLVVTIYTASKPRDRSHFEKFRSYHEKLYAQVEPASVTPFSPPALDRALHAIMAAYTRQFGDEHASHSPFPYPLELVEQLENLLLPRVREVDEAEVENFQKVFARRVAEWRNWKPAKWTAEWSDNDVPLLRAAGEYVSPERAKITWPTPLSMRNVDAGCMATIMSPRLVDGDDNDAKES